MSQNDGIGTWKWNDNLVPFETHDPVYTISFNFLSGGTTFDSVGLESGFIGTYIMSYKVASDTTFVYDTSQEPVWSKEVYKTIEITSSVTDQTFLTWLTANATYQGGSSTNQYLDETGLRQFSTKTKEYVDSKTQYQIKNIVIDESTKIIDITIEPVSGGGVTPEPVDELLGTWLFDEIPQAPEQALSAYIKFTTPATTENYIRLDTNATDPLNIRYVFKVTGTPEFTTAYGGSLIAPPSWAGDTYRTITITDTSTLTNRDEFTTWLKANAVKQTGGGG